MTSRFYDWYIRGWREVNNWITGTNVFEKEWDVLVLLDCARPDMIAEVSDEYRSVSSGRPFSPLRVALPSDSEKPSESIIAIS